MNQSSTDRILAGLRAWIASASPGQQLPSSRSLTAEYGASPVTVQKAVRRLVALGLVESRPGAGTFVSAPRATRPVDYGWQAAALGAQQSRAWSLSSTQRIVAPDAIALHSGYPAAELLPERAVRRAIAGASRTAVAMTRSPAAGLPELRAWFAGELVADMPAGIPPVSAQDVLVIAGSQSGLSSIFRAVAGQGRPLLIESPSYWGALLAAEQAGVTVVPVPAGPAGPDPADVERAFAETGARAFYAQPNFANPSGAVWPDETRRAVLESARRHGAFLVEDDWAHDLAIGARPRPVAALDDDGHVIYLRSLTKSVSPAVRVAAVIARGPARDRILADRAAESMYVSGLLQAAALEVVSQPGWATHLRGLRDRLRERRDLLVQSLGEHAPAVHLELVPSGGLNAWARLPDGTDVDRVVRDAELRGLVVAPGREWFPAEPAGPFVRLNYAGENPARFPEAARILAEVLAPPD
ncbi:PLP-dependent aminotransferase family protein [Agromyces sp. NPDC058064]|uniref:aminotransferase-like domain-containing protein n=1 Tax=Agromyces sp. NPDC058064 TaxID=3346322 RepID=UPI0036D8099B